MSEPDLVGLVATMEEARSAMSAFKKADRDSIVPAHAAPHLAVFRQVVGAISGLTDLEIGGELILTTGAWRNLRAKARVLLPLLDQYEAALKRDLRELIPVREQLPAALDRFGRALQQAVNDTGR